MSKLLIILSLAINIAFANSRFTEMDRADFMKDVKLELAEFKQENKGKIDLQIIKPALHEELMKYHKLQKFTREEMVKIKDAYEVYSKNPANADDEEKFYTFVDNQLIDINKSEIKKMKAGQICNSWVCDDKLKCAVDPKKEESSQNKCSVGYNSCKSDSDCCSGVCNVSETKKNKKVCEPIKRCFQPKKLGDACNENPVCEQGSCLSFNANTIGIGECKNESLSCKSDSECCSNSCNGGICKDNLVCKDCVSRGNKAENGKKCCEGLLKNSQNTCIPDMPPIVPPQVNNSRNNLMKTIASLFIQNASAQTAGSVIRGNTDKYGSFRAESTEVDEKEKGKLAEAKTDMKFSKTSNFETCNIHFRGDYYAYLKENKLFDSEISLLAFDYMMLGDANHDYWRSSKGNEATSIYGRLNTVAKKHDEIRKATNIKIKEIDRKLTCMCIDIKGAKNFTDPEKKKFFDTSCEEFKSAVNSDMNEASCKNLAGEKDAWQKSCLPSPTSGMSDEDCGKLKTTLESKEATCNKNPAEQGFVDDVASGDASGTKGKRMLVFYSSQMSSFNQSLTVDNTKIYKGIATVKEWMEKNEEKFSQTEFEYENGLTLSSFTVRNPGGSAAALGAALGAILAAGVIAILGGFAGGAMISTWAAAGIITASAATGAGGVWLVASLKGAWIAKHPEVYDQFVRSYGCGKKDTCTDYTRKLKQPYSKICNSHIANGACVKNFVVYELDGDQRYVLDPFIPVGVPKSNIIRGQGDYASELESGYQGALSYMNAVSPRGEVSESVMSTEFINEYVVGLYTPSSLRGETVAIHAMNKQLIEEIKTKAKEFAIKSEFLEANDKANLELFADYAYDYHFLWPKTSRKDEISYPTVGLDTYLDFMAHGAAANLSAGGSKAATTFGGLNTKYLEDYLNTLQMYKAQQTTGVEGDSKALSAEIANTQAALNANKTLQGLYDDKGNLLNNLNASTINGAAGKAGVSGAVSLTSGQLDFLNAVGTYRGLRNEQLKKQEAYVKAANASGVGAGSARAQAVSSSLKSFGGKFNNALTASNASTSSLFGTQGSNGSKDGDAKKSGSGSGYTSGYNSGSGSGGFNSGSKSSSSSSSSNKASSVDSSGGSGLASGANEDEDAKRLKEAVEARDKANQNKYSSTNETNSLFEKVTNAYIRNYDKVLTKKKQDKDVTDPK